MHKEENLIHLQLKCQKMFAASCLPESDRSLLLPLLEPDSILLLLADVLKSASLCTSLPQDSLLGLLSTGEGGELTSVCADRAGMIVLFAVFNSISCFSLCVSAVL